MVILEQQSYKLKIRFWPIFLGVVGVVGLVISIISANGFTLKHILISVGSIILLTIIGLVINMLIQYQSLIKIHNDFLTKYNELEKRHNSLSKRFDHNTKIIEKNKDFRNAIKNFLMLALIQFSDQENQSLVKLIALIHEMESKTIGDEK